MLEQRRTKREFKAKPIIKWAGGKTQLLQELRERSPNKFKRYIEPFIGGGALFFDLMPEQAIIADSNPELINLYCTVRDDHRAIIEILQTYENTEDFFYELRAKQFDTLSPAEAAARTIFLNRTCYNGLYRVNKKGHFNVPYGRYKKPNFCQSENLASAALTLKNTDIVLGDYKTVLAKHAQPGDFVFLDPPYLPISEYADFKRYTKEQFYDEDHKELADEVAKLQRLGCHVILTNSNHPLVHELYEPFDVEIISTKRNISSRSSTRKGEDVIVTAKPSPIAHIRSVPDSLPDQVHLYPPTRFMGSKEKLLPYIQNVVSGFEFETVTDLFSGSGIVSYMFKSMGKSVHSNDYMAMSSTFTKAMIENSHITLSDTDIDKLFDRSTPSDSFVQKTFKDLYFDDKDNAVIDQVRANIKSIRSKTKKALAMSALIRACLKKRPRGIFTYTGHRYDDGRADLRLSIEEQIRNAAGLINGAVFDNGMACKSRMGDAMSNRFKSDLYYLDPPYFSPLSDNEYVRRYHFVEGLARDWDGVEMQWHTKTQKFKSYPTPFSSRIGATDAFDKLFRKLKDSIIVVSYSSNSLPTKDEIVHLMAKYKRHVEVVDIDHRYSFANQKNTKSDIRNKVKEYLFIGY